MANNSTFHYTKQKSMAEIAMVSTFNYRDGIEEYTNELIKHLEKIQIKIKRVPISKSILKITKEIFNSNTKLVHIQHEYSLFWIRPFGVGFLILLLFLKIARKKVIVTLHTVYPISFFEKSIPSIYLKYPKLIIYMAKLGFLIITKLISILADRLIVLTPIGKYILNYEYRINNISFVPYGVHQLKNIDNSSAKEKLNLRNKVVLMCFGYPYPGKGFHYAIEALDILTKIYGYNNLILLLQDTRLPHDFDKCERYMQFLKRLVSLKNLQPYVQYLSYIPEELLPYYLSAVDIFIFPYEERLSSSSALMKTLSLNKIYIVTDISAFRFLKFFRFPNVIFVRPQSPGDIARAVDEILRNYTYLINSNSNIIKLLDWKSIAYLHSKIYFESLNGIV